MLDSRVVAVYSPHEQRVRCDELYLRVDAVLAMSSPPPRLPSQPSYTFLHLPTSAYLPTPAYTCLHLPTPAYTCLHLPTPA